MAQQIERNQEATVYIGNLDERCTESLIWELMLQAGPVGNDYLLLPTNSNLILYKC
jgi:splicing factor 3B subunit 4